MPQIDLTNPTSTVRAQQLLTFKSQLETILQSKAITAIQGLNAETVEGALAELLTKINNVLSTVYKPSGNIASAGLVSSLLVAANAGNVYNLTEEVTTTADWVEGAGKTIAAGTDVGIVAVEEGGSTVYKFNAYSTKIDLSGYKTIASLQNKGAANKGVYFDGDGNAQPMTYEVNKDVPANAVFTDTTYDVETAAQGGTAESLVTTGEKYTWNNKQDALTFATDADILEMFASE